MDTRAPILDGNVKRVLARYHAVAGWPGQRAVSDALWSHAHPRARVADYTQAIMDLGATCCARSRPACERCPLESHCAAGLSASKLISRQETAKGSTPRKCWLAVATRAREKCCCRSGRTRVSGVACGRRLNLTAPQAPSGSPLPCRCARCLPGRGSLSSHLHTFQAGSALRQGASEANRALRNRVECAAGNLKWFSLHPPPSVGLPAPIVRLLVN